MNRQGHQVSQRTVCDLLAQMHYSLQSVRKTRKGTQHPDRRGPKFGLMHLKDQAA